MEIRNLIAQTLERGKVDFSIWWKKTPPNRLPHQYSLGRKLLQPDKTISETCHIPLPEDWFATLLRMPDVLTRVDVQELSDEEWTSQTNHRKPLCNIWLTSASRKEQPRKEIYRKIDNIEQLMKSIEPYEKERVAKIRERITDALENAEHRL